VGFAVRWGRLRDTGMLATAKANKQAIYAYFGSKDALFAAAFEDRIRDFHASVLFDEYDLAEYGGQMFAKFEDTPETFRLVLLISGRVGSWTTARSDPPLERGQNQTNRGRPAGGQGNQDVSGCRPALCRPLNRPDVAYADTRARCAGPI